MKRCFALTGCLMSLMSISCVEDPQETSTQDQALIFGTVDHKPIDQFLNNSTYQIGARYGRAMASGTLNANNNPTNCSAFLIDDDIIVTARHCRGVTDTEANFTFGWWDTFSIQTPPSLYPESRDWMEQRLIELGLTPEQALNILPDAVLSERWTCTLIEHSGTEDIDYWRCPPKPMDIEYNERLHTFYLLPGMIWGHINVAHQPNKPHGSPLYLLGINQMPGQILPQTLLSPGGYISSSTANCLFDYQNCFEFLGADARKGHSGGPILDTKTHAAFGVFHGMSLPQGEDGTSFIGYDEFGNDGHNIGSYFSSTAVTLSTEPPVTRPVGATTQPTTWYGRQRTGPSRWRWAGTCPPNTMAAGIIGNTFHYPANPKFDGRLGNLGLICLPHTDEFNTHFDRGVVVSPNTLVIEQQHPTDGMDFNTYVNEVYGYRFDTNVYERQHVAMCPPGYYMRGMSMSYDSESIRQINAIFCEHPESGHRGVTSVYDRFGTQIGQNVATPACADGSFITGIDAAKEWNVEGASFMCNAL